MIKYRIFIILFFFSFLYSQETYKYVGSAKSDKYHYKDCRWAKKILDKNLVTFKDENDAVKQGYIACKVCKPPVPGKSIKSNDKKEYKPKSKVATQCLGTTKKGKRCKRKTNDTSGYCWQHK